MMSIWTALAAVPFLVEEGPAPEDVKAGWLGFAVWIGLAVAVVLLALSFRKHVGRVNFEERDNRPETDPTETDQHTSNGTA